MHRRTFFKTSGVLGAAALLPGLSNAESLFSALKTNYPPPGLQMYTLRILLDAPGANTNAILKQMADIGIKELESASGSGGLYYGKKPKELSAMINDYGMKWIGNHVGGLPRTPPPAAGAPPSASRNLRDNLQQIVDEAAEGGCTWVICSSSAVSNMDQIKRTTEVFAKAGEAARKNKMKFAYHNHQSEFDKIEGTSAYEYVIGQTNKDEVFMEVDLAWATAAGMDPVAMFKQFPGRFPLWHVKDLDKVTGQPCRVGTGKVDFKRIFTNSQLSGVQHTFIEQDTAKTIDDPAAGVKWLKENIYV